QFDDHARAEEALRVQKSNRWLRATSRRATKTQRLLLPSELRANNALAHRATLRNRRFCRWTLGVSIEPPSAERGKKPQSGISLTRLRVLSPARNRDAAVGAAAVHSLSSSTSRPGSSRVFSTRTERSAPGSRPRLRRIVGATCEVATGVLITFALNSGLETISPTLVSPKLKPPCSAFFFPEWV